MRALALDLGHAAGTNSVSQTAAYAAPNRCGHTGARPLPCPDPLAAVRGERAGEEFQPAVGYMQK